MDEFAANVAPASAAATAAASADAGNEPEGSSRSDDMGEKPENDARPVDEQQEPGAKRRRGADGSPVPAAEAASVPAHKLPLAVHSITAHALVAPWLDLDLLAALLPGAALRDAGRERVLEFRVAEKALRGVKTGASGGGANANAEPGREGEGAGNVPAQQRGYRPKPKTAAEEVKRVARHLGKPRVRQLVRLHLTAAEAALTADAPATGPESRAAGATCKGTRLARLHAHGHLSVDLDGSEGSLWRNGDRARMAVVQLAHYVRGVQRTELHRFDMRPTVSYKAVVPTGRPVDVARLWELLPGTERGPERPDEIEQGGGDGKRGMAGRTRNRGVHGGKRRGRGGRAGAGADRAPVETAASKPLPSVVWRCPLPDARAVVWADGRVVVDHASSLGAARKVVAKLIALLKRCEPTTAQLERMQRVEAWETRAIEREEKRERVEQEKRKQQRAEATAAKHGGDAQGTVDGMEEAGMGEGEDEGEDGQVITVKEEEAVAVTKEEGVAKDEQVEIDDVDVKVEQSLLQ